MKHPGPPTFETLIDGPPDAHRLFSKIDELARALFVIGNLANTKLIWDDDNSDLDFYARVKSIADEALNGRD